jgi:hypothetical protein
LYGAVFGVAGCLGYFSTDASAERNTARRRIQALRSPTRKSDSHLKRSRKALEAARAERDAVRNRYHRQRGDYQSAYTAALAFNRTTSAANQIDLSAYPRRDLEVPE